MSDLKERPRRLRQNGLTRSMVKETELHLSSLIQPYFLASHPTAQEPIFGFTGIYRFGVDLLSNRIEADLKRGVRNYLLFAHIPEDIRSADGKAAIDDKGLLPSGIRALRARFGKEILLFSDVCLCTFTSHGHCGIIEGEKVANDPSVALLAQQALAHAKAGVDFVAPSDMMDGRVLAIRQLLDKQGFEQVGILSYTAKYASHYYGPFREALGSSPKASGNLRDRSTYQMDFRNSVEALRELRLDIEEGADIVMVKPALAYLDIIAQFAKTTDLPVAAYSVSGEYEMVKQLAAAGVVEESKLAIENLIAIRRAGARIIISYFTTEIAEKGWLK